MLQISGFLAALWIAGKISRLIGVSSIVMEVGVGIVLGPQAAKMIPSELGECFQDQKVDCDTRKWQLDTAQKGTEYCDVQAYIDKGTYVLGGASWTTGFFGSTSSVTLDGKYYCLDPSGCSGGRRLESSASDVEVEENPFEIAGHVGLQAVPRRLKKDQKGKTKYDSYSDCLKEACKLDVALECAYNPDVFTLVGHTGVALMIFESGLHFDFEQAKTVGPWACAVAILGTFLPLVTGTALSLAFGFELMDSLSAGTALAPTSVGIALKLLHEAKALQLYFGQAVMTAAFVDDVLSLVLFSVLFNLGDDPTFLDFVPLICGCIFMVVAIIAAVTVWPKFITWLFNTVKETKPNAKLTKHDEVMWLLMFVTLVIYATITDVCGTHLWGCFIAGMSFATQHHAHHVWVRQVKRTTCWWLRVFFGCTLAWSIPVSELFSIEAFWKGTIMGIGPCIATKVLCGPFMGDARWVIGWAMVGRAEFAYFIAILAKSLTLMDEKLFAILVWALIYATIFAPLIFRYVLVGYMAKLEASGDPAVKTEEAKEKHDLKHAASSRISLSDAHGRLPDVTADMKAKAQADLDEKEIKLQAELEQKNSRIKELEALMARLESDEKNMNDQIPPRETTKDLAEI
jgi:Kef-type K+ transport system membrane component KefB